MIRYPVKVFGKELCEQAAVAMHDGAKNVFPAVSRAMHDECFRHFLLASYQHKSSHFWRKEPGLVQPSYFLVTKVREDFNLKFSRK
jgi:hypothetical protein